MVKLYPPMLEGTLPAFYSDEKGIVNITIPFSMNRAVSHTQIGGFELKIKTVQNGNFIYTLQTFDFNDYDIENVNTYVKFRFKDEDGLLKMGQFYKFQLAYWYIDEAVKTDSLNKYYQGEYSFEDYSTIIQKQGNIGYYSSTSVAKYTTKPSVEILNLRKGFLNAYAFSYTGRYSQNDQIIPVWDNNGDPVYVLDEYGQETNIQQTYTFKRDTTEKVYTYRFDVYDANDVIIYTSGDCLHNSSSDTNIDFSEDIYALKAEIPNDTIYYIQYTVTTLNKLIISTPRYKLIKRAGLESELAITLDAELNFNNGYIDLSVSNKRDNTDLPVAVTGAFLLLRSSSDGNFEDWQEMFKFKLANQRLPDGILYKDFTVEQGKSYKYAIQQYSNNNLFSSKITSNSVYVDFEDAFLFDGQRQLKIRFNPKMSKFSNNRLESKTETIGSKYPFIFRNGQVNYHEFSLSGLISYLSDEEFLFLSREELGVEDLHRHTSNISRFLPSFENEISGNVARERLFKMKVLEWLNDGQPKIFRSPTEGNFIVRLMKISLAPQEKLSRLLHTFNCTAYEIADFSYANLCNMKFIDPTEPDNLIVNWVTIDLNKVMPSRENKTVNINPDTYETIKNIQTVRFDDMTPGERIRITYINGNTEILTIGPTGRLYLDKVTPINSIIIEPMYQRIKAFNEREYFNKEYYVRADDNTYHKSYNSNAAGEPIIIPDKTYQREYYKRINSRTTGLITFSYYVEQTNAFDNISNVVIEDSQIREFIGEHNILRELAEIPLMNEYSQLIENQYIRNPKIDIIDMYYIKVSRRPVESVWLENNKYYIYYNEKSDIALNLDKVHPYTLFFNHNWTSGDGPYYDEFYTEFYTTQQKQYEAYDASITINNQKIIVDRDMIIPLKDFDDITEIISGNGVIVEIAYLERRINYFIEDKHSSLMGNNSFQFIKSNFELSFINQNFPNYDGFLQQYIQYCNRLNKILHQ